MQVDRRQVIELMRSRGDDARAQQAEADLPDPLDTSRDAGLLAQYGVTPADLNDEHPLT